MSFDSKCQPLAAADLGERVGARLRMGCGFLGAAAVYLFAHDVLVGLDPEGSYRSGLEELNVPQAYIDSAVAAIIAGKHPVDSLPGWLELEVENTQKASAGTANVKAYSGLDGETEMAERALDRIGAGPKKPTETEAP